MTTWWSESVPLLLQHHEQLLQFCKDLGVVISMEKRALEPSSETPYLQDADRHYPRKGLPNRLSDCKISLQVPSSPSSSFKDVAAVAGPHGIPGTVHSQGWAWICLLQCQLKTCWSTALNKTAEPVPLSEECTECISWWLQKKKGYWEFPSRWVFRILLFTNASKTSWGVYLRDLTAAGVWPPEEKELHTIVLEMRAIQLALKSSFPGF